MGIEIAHLGGQRKQENRWNEEESTERRETMWNEESAMPIASYEYYVFLISRN